MGKEQFVYEQGIIAEIEERQEQSTVDVLMSHEPGFTIYSYRRQPTMGHGPALVYSNIPYRGINDYIWMGNNVPQDKKEYETDEEIFPGVFRIDREHKRVLYIPDTSSSHRDSYRAGNTIYTYEGRLLDMLLLLEEQAFSFEQVSWLTDVGVASLDVLPRSSVHIIIGVTARAADIFEEVTGIDRYQAFQREGSRTLQQIRDNNLLAITPLTEEDVQKKEQYIDRLREGWRRSL